MGNKTWSYLMKNFCWSCAQTSLYWQALGALTRGLLPTVPSTQLWAAPLFQTQALLHSSDLALHTLSSTPALPVPIAFCRMLLTSWGNYSLAPAVHWMLFLLKTSQFVPVVHSFLFSPIILSWFYNNNCYQLPLHFPRASNRIPFWNAQARGAPYNYGPFLFRQAAVGTNSLMISLMA